MTNLKEDSPTITPMTSEDENSLPDDEDIPEEFICCLTLQPMVDPLMDRRGMNFERAAITEWLNRGNHTCPLTREPLSYSKLIPNAALRMRIERWKQQHGMDVESTYIQPKERKELLCCIEAPPNTLMNQFWNLQLAEEALQSIEQPQNARRRRHRRHRLLGGGSNSQDPANLTPNSRRRYLVGILDSALSAVRRSPLTDNQE